jgi:hypothetical protein
MRELKDGTLMIGCDHRCECAVEHHKAQFVGACECGHDLGTEHGYICQVKGCSGTVPAGVLGGPYLCDEHRLG